MPPARQSFYKQFRRKRTPIAGTGFVLQDGRVDIAESALHHRSGGHPAGLRADRGARLPLDAECRRPPGRCSSRARRAYAGRPIFVERIARDSLGTSCGARAAHHARARHPGVAYPGISRHRRAGDPRLLSPLYGRRAYISGRSTPYTPCASRNLPWQRRYATLLTEIDRLDLFFLALLMHDTGKARRSGDHTVESVELADSLLGSPGSRSGRARDGSETHPQSPGDVDRPAPGYLRPRYHPRLRRKGSSAVAI